MAGTRSWRRRQAERDAAEANRLHNEAAMVGGEALMVVAPIAAAAYRVPADCRHGVPLNCCDDGCQERAGRRS